MAGDEHIDSHGEAPIKARVDGVPVDETPAAYEDIDRLMAAQSDLVDVVHTVEQVVCVKG